MMIMMIMIMMMWVRHGGEKGFQLFVNNISWKTSSQALEDHFRQIGAVEHSIVATDRNGRHKGFGFVRYASAKDSARAIESLNGVELMGRRLVVQLDREA